MAEPCWKTIDDLRNIFIRKYQDSELGSELEKACSEEYELVRDYNGRQILELLQNVDDACDETEKHINKSKDVVVKISFKNNLLEVGNTGTAFSAETIERLCLGRASNKSSENIGNKGTGFRSLLNDAEYIELYSGNFSIKFSERYTQKIFNDYKNKKKIKDQISNWKKDYPLRFPIMNCPEQIEKINTEFDTLIRVKIKQDNTEKENSIENQLKQPFYKSLLFLPNITKIIIEVDDEIKEFSKIVDNQEVFIEEKINKKIQKTEKYFLYSKEVDINGKFANLIIAIPKDDYDFSNEKVYCYFPIRNFQTPIHALIHAPFITNSSRDDIPNDDKQINKSIFKKIVLFIKEIAEKLTDKNISELPLKTLVPFKSKLWSSDGFNLENYYNDLLKTARILPTVNNKNISFEDEPKLFESDFPKEFSDVQFGQLLIHLNNECTDFVLKLSKYYNYNKLNYERDELIKKVNILAENWDIKVRVKIFIWWSKNFEKNVSFPNLLKDSKDNWIECSSKVYLPTDTGISVLPDELSWVNLCILKQSYVDEIIEQAKENYSDEWNKYCYEHNKPGDKRILSDISSKFAVKFTEQSSLSLIISSINQQIVTFEQSKSFINWFFKEYKDKDLGNEVLDISFKLPNQKGEIKSIKELYLGKEYGNSIAEKLFSNTSKTAFISIDKIYNGDEKKEFVNFLKKCGILEFPRIIELKENNSFEWQFKQFVSEKYFSNKNANYLTSYTIENFQKLISTLSTKEIKIWFEKDIELRNFLLSQEEKSTVKSASNYYPNYFHSNAYLKYILNNTSWIELKGKKYPPCKIIKNARLGDNVDGVFGISESELKQNIGETIAINFKLDFKESLAELSDSELKKILDVLPNFDKGEISRNLYSDIIKFKKGKKPKFSTENLKLLAKDGKFYKNSEIKYADKRTCLSEKNKSKFIWIQPKQSIETIENWLGVERYKSNYKLNNFDLIEIEDFTSEINDIKVAVLCTIDSNKQNINSIRNLEIIPCAKIEVIDIEQNSEHILLSDFFFVNDNNKYYLKISKDSDIKSIRNDNDFADAIVEIFKQALNLDLNSNLVELLVTKNKVSKIKKIEEQYNSDAWNNSNEELFNKNPLNEFIYNFFREHNLEKKLYKELITFDFTSDLQFEKIEILIHSLKNISKDIDDLNSLSDLLDINICSFLRQNLKKCLDSHYEEYRNKLYISICNLNHEEKCKFLQRVESYKNFDVSKLEIANSVNIDFSSIVLQNFPILNNENNETIDIDRIYNNNVHTVIEKSKISQSDFDDFIQNNSEFNSILYFEIPSQIQSAINEYMSGRAKQEKDIEVDNDCETKTVTVRLEEMNLPDYKNLKTRKERSKIYYEDRNSLNQKAGEKAEIIAYKELKKKYPKIIWHSQYTTDAADRNNSPPNGIVCDMWVFDSEKGNLYFEIKSATTEFEMTIDEYESMKNNKDRYFIILVNLKTREISYHKFEEIDSLKKIESYVFTFKQV